MHGFSVPTQLPHLFDTEVTPPAVLQRKKLGRYNSKRAWTDNLIILSKQSNKIKTLPRFRRQTSKSSISSGKVNYGKLLSVCYPSFQMCVSLATLTPMNQKLQTFQTCHFLQKHAFD